MKQYNITGMSCAACAARIEKAVNEVDGVTSCSVSLLTNSMGVEGSAQSSEIIRAVNETGYGATVKGKEKNDSSASDEIIDTETLKIKKRLIASLVFLIPLMYISMGHMMWGWPLPSIIQDNHIAMGLLQLLFTAIVMVINQKFFINGFKGIISKAPNMDSLVALGAGASFVYSTYALFEMTVNPSRAAEYMDSLYFESAAMILTLITVGKMLESYSKGKTTNALKGLMNLAPKTACIIRNGDEIAVDIDEVSKGDIFIVRPGESVPVDGIVIEGNSAINESVLTGESIPVDKEKGDRVSAATINQSGFIKCEATRVGEDTMLSQIIKTVSEAAATKAPIAKIADRVSGVFVPIVICIALVTFAVWMLTGQAFGYSLSRAISVLVISCPCALGLATPVAVMVGNGKGAKNGILFKNAASLEEAGRIKIVALDKTGTITQGTPTVTDIVEFDIDLLKTAYSIEKMSEHPLARAIVDYAVENRIKSVQASDFKALAGNGLTAQINGEQVYGGSIKYIQSIASIDESAMQRADELASEGKTPLLFVKSGKLLGIIAVADTIKQDSPQAIKELQSMGISVVMLTGDNKQTANAIGKQVGVDKVFAEVLPDGKEQVIAQLKERGKVAMVGDGINDAPALTTADIGMAIDAGTDIAIDAADVVLMNSRLSDVPAAIRLSRKTLTNIRENLFWAFIYNIIGIPLAAGCWVSITGWTLSPMFAAGAMSLSSVCVVLNALRLNSVKIYNSRNDRKTKPINIEIKENKNMTMTIKIEGMMCAHCEANVKKILEGFAEIDEASADHESNTATIKCNAEPNTDAIKKAIGEAGYTVID